jgi:hypothetical protein
MAVHLLGKLVGDLHGLDLGAERTPEYALDKAFDASFEIAQNADRCTSSRLGHTMRSLG